MWTIAGKVDFLGLMEEGCYLLKGVGTDIIHRLSFGSKVFARKGTVLIEEGHENDALFVVGHGTLSVSVHGEEIATVGPGQVIGLYTLLKGTNASASVIVASDLAYVLELRHSARANPAGRCFSFRNEPGGSTNEPGGGCSP
ncbi:unnamed protein product [Effrenium voratum]|nr:unnamed protein product [Effrenium voratum]